MGEGIWFAFDIQKFYVSSAKEINSLSIMKSISLPMYKLSGISLLDNVKELTQNYTYRLNSPIGLDLEDLTYCINRSTGQPSRAGPKASETTPWRDPKAKTLGTILRGSLRIIGGYSRARFSSFRSSLIGLSV